MKNFILLLLLQFSALAFAQPGSLDTTFNPGTGPNEECGIFCSALQTDGKIIIGGYFTSFNGLAKNRIARLNADGSVDKSFTSGFIPGQDFDTAVKNMRSAGRKNYSRR